MKKLAYISVIVLAVIASACTADPFKDLEGSDWKKERNITSLLLEGQMGTAVIERDFDDATIKVFARIENIEDLSKVEVKAIELAYGASSSVAVGSTLDFSTEKAMIPVTSGAGEVLNWEVSIHPFVSDLEGAWYIGEMGMYCDMFTWESWGWEEYLQIPDYLPESSPELDNVITFEVEGADVKGNPYGRYVHDAGNDGEYGSFSDSSQDWEYNERFRKIPTGEGTWLRDYERNKVIITAANNMEYELDLDVLNETNEVALNAELAYRPELFDWNNTNWSYEKVANMSKKMWYKLTRERVVQTGNDIKGMTVAGQVGDAAINTDTKEVTVVIENNGADISDIELTGLSLSYAATADKAVGDKLNFSSGNAAQITVTSEAGEAVVWTIKLQIDLDPGDVSIAGTWTVADIYVYCDLFTWESWGWDKTEKLTNYLPNANTELDNTITFTVEGVNESGKPYGNYEHNAGADGEFGNFTSDDASWPESDFNARYRQVPTGNGTWVLDGESLTITDSGSTDFTITLEVKSETEIALTKELEYKSELFDWDVQNYSYEEVAHMSKKMWYNLNKQ